MASFESMSDVELRKKLVEHGYDIPVAGNRDFIIKKLTKLQEGPVCKGRGGRKSTPVVSSRPTPTPPPATNNGRGGTPISRLSLNDSGQGQRRSASRDSDRLPPPAATPRAGSSRRSVGSAVETASNKSNSSATGRPQRNSLPPQAYSSASSSRLRQVVETVEDDEEEESSSEEDSVLLDSSMNGDHDDHVEDMDVEDDRPVSRDRQRAPTTPYRSSKVTTNSSFSRTTTTTAPTSFSTTKPRMGFLTPSTSTPYSANTSSATSSRFEKYYNYFRNNTDSSRDGGDPLLYSYSRTGTPGCMSPSSTAATVGSPSFNRSYPNTSFMSEDCSADEEEEDFETEEGGRPRRWLRKLNPLNLVRGLWWRRSNSEDVQTDLNSSGNDVGGLGGRTFSQQTPVSSLESSGKYSYSASPVSRIQVTGPASAAVAHRLYPPTRVPPAVAAGRQAGFQLFASRGERNGVGSGGGIFSDWTNIPKLIVLAIFALFAIIAISYCLKTVNVSEDSKGVLTGSSAPAPVDKKSQQAVERKIKYCICGTSEADPEACVPTNYIREARDLVGKLKSELVQRAAWKGCSDDDKLNFASAKKVAAGLMGVKMSDVEALFRGALILINENPNYYGLVIESDGKDEFTTREVLDLDPETSFVSAGGVRPNFMCLAYAWISNVVFYLGCFTAMGVVGYLSYMYLMSRRSKQMREEEEVFKTVQQVIEMLQDQQELSKANNSIEGYLAINHIRDALIPPQERKKKEALWKAVANHISTQESRVREEVQHLSGEEYQVWRWMAEASPLPSPQTNRRNRPSVVPTSPSQSGSSEGASPAASPRLYPSLDTAAQDLNNLSGNGEDNLWQGQAFEVNAGSPNALMRIPSTCLKIRQMYDPNRGADEERRVIIGRAIQQKCGASRILHIGIDPNVSDGSVYLLCQSREDARSAFSALHGWWFEGNLLSVKFLREERYFERFPEARSLYIPSSGISGQGSFRDQLRTGFN